MSAIDIAMEHEKQKYEAIENAFLDVPQCLYKEWTHTQGTFQAITGSECKVSIWIWFKI